MRDVAVILTAYNRPKLVADSIRSVREQDCDRWKLYIMDDGSNQETRDSITRAIEGSGSEIFWWQGVNRSLENRQVTISYSRNINIALGMFAREERYVTYLCDDDILYPESVRVRAGFLDETQDADVVYGRLRAVQFSSEGFNSWDRAVRPVAGMCFPRPTGKRVYHSEGQASKTYFTEGGKDKETGLGYVEEGMWKQGPLVYGHFGRQIPTQRDRDNLFWVGEGMVDHNQVMHRRSCLEGDWPQHYSGKGTEWWGEDARWRVGDYSFFMRLTERGHLFWGINEWVASKKYHCFSDGVVSGEDRE